MRIVKTILVILVCLGLGLALGVAAFQIQKRYATTETPTPEQQQSQSENQESKSVAYSTDDLTFQVPEGWVATEDDLANYPAAVTATQHTFYLVEEHTQLKETGVAVYVLSAEASPNSMRLATGRLQQRLALGSTQQTFSLQTGSGLELTKSTYASTSDIATSYEYEAEGLYVLITHEPTVATDISTEQLEALVKSLTLGSAAPTSTPTTTASPLLE